MLVLAEKISACACFALHEELITFPKPGLVSKIDNGSHQDMNYATFVASINSLQNYFRHASLAGFSVNDFEYLKQLGIEAEKTMLQATGGINTHRGVIFIFGLLIASLSICLKNRLPFVEISPVISQTFGKSLLLHKTNNNSHGQLVRTQYNLESIIDSAICGFPLLFDVFASFEDWVKTSNYELAKLRSLFTVMAQLDDTNLVYRGGIQGLVFARAKAKEVLLISDDQQFLNFAKLLHHEFILRNLSPGGAADYLAAVLFLFEVKKLWV